VGNNVSEISIKRGDTFSFGAANIALDQNQNWSARAQIRDPLVGDLQSAICELEVTLTASVAGKGWDLWLYASQQQTAKWPVDKNYGRPRTLVCDVQFTRLSKPQVVITTNTLQILVYRDVTQNE
jgi:hypothetical protein